MKATTHAAVVCSVLWVIFTTTHCFQAPDTCYAQWKRYLAPGDPCHPGDAPVDCQQLFCSATIPKVGQGGAVNQQYAERAAAEAMKSTGYRTVYIEVKDCMFTNGDQKYQVDFWHWRAAYDEHQKWPGTKDFNSIDNIAVHVDCHRGEKNLHCCGK